MTMNSHQVQPMMGALVVSADGQDLGRVKEVQGDCFKVDAPMQFDYWLATDLASSLTEGTIRLNVNHDMLEQVKQDGPEHSGYHRHM